MPSITSTDAATVSLRGIAFDNSTEAYNNSANALANMASDVSVLGSVQPGHQLPHVDDITAFPRDIDVNQSVKRLLDTAELSLRSAETSRDFRRPGIALKEYIKASYICVVTIKGHKDYPTLQSGWGDLTKKHNALLRKIDALHGTYEQIKKDIKEDNLRTGARPAASKAAAHPQANGMAHTLSEPPLPGHQALNLALSQQNRQSQPPLSFQAFHGKSKPPIQPKPESLHGNALKGGHGRSSSASVAQDSLALRLAALRGPQPSPGQDPRIRTHPIVPPKPAGPREMPSTKPKIGIDSSVSSFPKMPDAIYSPVRGTVTDEAAKLPSSTPRGLFSRTGSSTSITSNPNAPTQQSYMDYSPPPPSDSPSLDRRLMQPSSATSSPRPSLDVPSGETITAQKLFEVMKAKGSILIMDIRPREDFDEGHIMSTSTICLEPDILTRESLSCDQISESLILSPIQEKSAFDKRSEYDLVVMYDDATEAMPRLPRNTEELALVSLRRALVDLNYGRELKQPPRLLQGGIEAWVNLLGPSSLQSTSESSTKTAQLRLGNHGQISRKKSKYLAKPLKPDDVKAWQNTVNQDDADIASSPMLYRTTEDFIRRYPAVSLEQESMTSPAAEPLVMSNRPAGASHWGSDAPIPPAKPGKAVARPTHNGLSHEGGENGSSQQASGQMTANSRPKGPPDGPNGPARRFRYTTLNNPGSWCYSNSLLQAFFASGLGKVLSSHDWKNEFPVPKKEGERIPQPQLMMQILANLFHWMSTGGFEVMKAQTFMSYSLHVSKQIKENVHFGDHNQHDPDEFFDFITAQLEDETNRKRDQARPQERYLVSTTLGLDGDFTDLASAHWARRLESCESIVEKYFGHFRAKAQKCMGCGYTSVEFEPQNRIIRTLGEDTTPTTLDELMRGDQNETLEGIQDCDKCHKTNNRQVKISYYQLPDVLVFTFNGQATNTAGRFAKVERHVRFELDNLDMSEYGRSPREKSNVYECFAVIHHIGEDLNSGHYTSYIRSAHDNSSFIYFDDSKTPEEIKGPARDRLYKHGRFYPRLVFYRRKEVSKKGPARRRI